MKKFSEILLIGCFVIFIAAAMAGTVMDRGRQTSYYENRNLASMPAFSADDVLGGKFFSDLETFLVDHAGGRETSVILKTRLDLDTFKRPVVNDVVAGSDVLLAFHKYGELNVKDIPERADRLTSNLKEVSSAAESCGGHYCYVAVPHQFYCRADSYPWYMDNGRDFADTEIRYLSGSLSKAGVDFLDVGPAFEADGMPGRYSSREDNHYTMYGAFRTYKEVMEKLGQISGKKLQTLTDDDVVFEKVPNPYMGAYERKLLDLRLIDEHLYRLEPRNPVDFTLTVDGKEMEPKVYYPPESDTEEVTYSYYMGGDLDESVIDTHRPDLPSILIYGDSYTDALECILYNSFDKMYSLDMRYNNKATVADYIRKYRPDYVICVRDYYHLLESDGNGGR